MANDPLNIYVDTERRTFQQEGGLVLGVTTEVTFTGTFGNNPVLMIFKYDKATKVLTPIAVTEKSGGKSLLKLTSQTAKDAFAGHEKLGEKIPFVGWVIDGDYVSVHTEGGVSTISVADDAEALAEGMILITWSPITVSLGQLFWGESRGLSAYELAVKYGYKGTEEEWSNLYATREAARDKAYAEAEAERNKTFVDAENARSVAALKAEADRRSAFDTKEEARQSTFDAKEAARDAAIETITRYPDAWAEANENAQLVHETAEILDQFKGGIKVAKEVELGDDTRGSAYAAFVLAKERSTVDGRITKASFGFDIAETGTLRVGVFYDGADGVYCRHIVEGSFASNKVIFPTPIEIKKDDFIGVWYSGNIRYRSSSVAGYRVSQINPVEGQKVSLASIGNTIAASAKFTIEYDDYNLREKTIQTVTEPSVAAQIIDQFEKDHALENFKDQLHSVVENTVEGGDGTNGTPKQWYFPYRPFETSGTIKRISKRTRLGSGSPADVQVCVITPVTTASISPAVVKHLSTITLGGDVNEALCDIEVNAGDVIGFYCASRTDVIGCKNELYGAYKPNTTPTEGATINFSGHGYLINLALDLDIEHESHLLKDKIVETVSKDESFATKVNTIVDTNIDARDYREFLSPAKGKSFVFLGDSITNDGYWVSTFNAIVKPKWSKKYAVSSAHWDHTSATVYDLSSSPAYANNVIYNQVNRLIKDFTDGVVEEPDVVMIAAGTNSLQDVADSDPDVVFADMSDYIVGQISALPEDVRNFNSAKAIRYCVELLRSYFKRVNVILLTPLFASATSRPSPVTIKAGDVIEKCANYLCCGCIRQDKGMGIYMPQEEREYFLKYGIRRADDPDKSSRTAFNTRDMLHPNTVGGEMCGRYIANRTMALMK